MFLFLDNKFTF